MIALRMIAVMLALLLAQTACAHEQKESITRVLFNPRTGNIEVMHRFLLHDVEHASRQLFGETSDLLSNNEDRTRFERYVHGRFALADRSGTAIALTPVGNEIEGRFLWVYAEAAIPANLSALTMTHEALIGVWPGQINLVNVERGTDIRSAVFASGSGQITVAF